MFSKKGSMDKKAKKMEFWEGMQKENQNKSWIERKEGF